jgi:ribosomal protein S17E
MIIKKERIIMNTYLGLALIACLSIASTPLLAEVVPAPKHPATSTTELKYPSELQRENAEHNKANVTKPATPATELKYPSELQRENAEHNKAVVK